MKHKLLITALLLISAVLFTGCSGNSSDEANASLPASAAESVQSAAESAKEDASETSGHRSEENAERSSEESAEQSAGQSSEPAAKHGQKLTDIVCKERSDEEIRTIITKTYDELTNLEISDPETSQDNDQFLIKTVEVSFPVSAANLNVVKRMVENESYNLFTEKLWINASENDFRCKLLMYCPYPKEGTSLSQKEIQSFIKDRYRAIDRINLTDTLLSIHRNYLTQSLSCRFTPDSDNKVGINTKVDFGTYNGFSRYTYQVTHDKGGFELSKSDYTVEGQEGSSQVYHADLVLTTTQFTVS